MEAKTSAFDAQAWFDEEADLMMSTWPFVLFNSDAAEQAEARRALSAMFLVFGTFTIAAGSLPR